MTNENNQNQPAPSTNESSPQPQNTPPAAPQTPPQTQTPPQPQVQPQGQYAAPAPVAPKQKSSALKIIGIIFGCGCLALIAFILFVGFAANRAGVNLENVDQFDVDSGEYNFNDFNSAPSDSEVEDIDQFFQDNFDIDFEDLESFNSNDPGSGSSASLDFNGSANTGASLNFSPVYSLNNFNINSSSARQVEFSELKLALEAFRILDQKNWRGNDGALPLSPSDFSSSFLNQLSAEQSAKTQGLTIPNDLGYLYKNTTEINNLIFTAREEFLRYAAARGVNQKYINEVNSRVLPADPARFTYDRSLTPNRATFVEGYRGPNGKVNDQLQMATAAVDFYNGARLVMESGILGPRPINSQALDTYYRQARDIGLRWYIYHEMTHVLDRAYLNLNTDEPDQLFPYDDINDTLARFDTAYFWNWGIGGKSDLTRNLDVSRERQAEGVAFEILVANFDLSNAQANALWEHLFGRLRTGNQQLNQIRQISEREYPNFPIHKLDTALGDVFAKSSDATFKREFGLSGLSGRLTALPAYGGYLNPMRPEDSAGYWSLLAR